MVERHDWNDDGTALWVATDENRRLREAESSQPFGDLPWRGYLGSDGWWEVVAAAVTIEVGNGDDRCCVINPKAGQLRGMARALTAAATRTESGGA